MYIRKRGKRLILVLLVGLIAFFLWTIISTLHLLRRDFSRDTIPVNDDSRTHEAMRAQLSSRYLASNGAYHISEDPDIYKRGKWQRSQIASFCRKNGLERLNHTLLDENHLFRDELFRHIIYDNKSRSLFCFMPKVGCTNMRMSLFISKGYLLPIVAKMKKQKSLLERKLELALKHSSFLNQKLTDSDRLLMIKEYKRYTIVRHPLERLLSAFRDKLEGPLIKKPFKQLNYFETLKHHIMNEHSHEEYVTWNASNIFYDVQISFSAFLKWIISEQETNLNEHFVSQFYNCEPCRMDYHFYGNFKNFTADASSILKEFGSKIALQLNPYHSKGMETFNQLRTYYSSVPKQLRKMLYSRLLLEFEFYHRLYPNEYRITELLINKI